MKRYVKQETNTVHYIADVQRENPHVSIPDDADCSSFGYEFLIETVAPVQVGFDAVEIAPVNNTQTWELRAKVVYIPQVVTMRQARLALLKSNLLTIVDTAIASGTDEAMKIEWEYATEVRRDWSSLITLSTELNLTSTQLDELFILGAKL